MADSLGWNGSRGQIAVTDIADKLVTSCGSAYSIFYDDLMYHNLCKVM
jgi:hypothetical protein